MKNPQRFMNGEKYVEIAAAISEPEGHVWFVESNIDFKDLPVQFRARIPDSDEQGIEKLKKAVLSWAELKGYNLV